MKRVLMIVFATVMAFTANAQTNFREISYNDAIAAAKAEGKLVFMDFYTDWCGPCKKMARDVFPQEQLGKYMNEHFVSIKINAEKGEGVELAKTYKITAYPTFIVIDTDKNVKGRTEGARNAGEFEEELERQINPDKAPDAVTKRYNEGDRSVSTVKAYASLLQTKALKDRRNYAMHMEEVIGVVQDYFKGLSDKDRYAAENLFVYENYTQNLDDPSAKFLVSNLSKFPSETRIAATAATEKFFNDVFMKYFTGYQKVDPALYEQAKKDIKKLKIDKEGKLAEIQSFIDVYAKGDMEQYIEYVDKNFDSLSDERQQYLANMFSHLFTDCDAATKKRAARCLRNHLSNLPYNIIYFSAQEIGTLEGVAGH